MRAKGDFNADAEKHGDPKRTEQHAGDISNLLADAQGEAMNHDAVSKDARRTV